MLYPFHFPNEDIDPKAALQALGLETLLQRQNVADTLAGLALFTATAPAYYQETPDVFPPNWLIVQDKGDWWVYFAGVNAAPNVIGAIVGGIGQPFSSSVLVHAFFDIMYTSHVKPIIDGIIGTPGAGVKVHFSGHSYGGALAFRAAVDYAARFGNATVECLTYGQPRLFTLGLPTPAFAYTRIAFVLDPVCHLPPVTAGLSSNYVIGIPGVPNIWTHYGRGLACNTNGTLSNFPNLIDQVTLTNLVVYSSSAQWHNYSNYITAMEAATPWSDRSSAAWQSFGNLIGLLPSGGIDSLPFFAPPTPNSIYDANKINQVYYGGQNIVQQRQPFNFVVLDTVYDAPALDNINPSTGFFPGGSSIVGLYQVEIHYAAFNNSWKERYCTNASGTANALKFGIGDLAPFLSWRPPGTIIQSMKASLVANPRQGDIKHLQTGFGIPSSTNRRGVTNDCALVEMRLGGQKVTVRSYRGWQDGLISYKADGTPDNVAAAQGALNIMATALLTSPAWQCLGWQPKTNSPRNYYRIINITNNNDGTANLVFSPADWTALTNAATFNQVLIQGIKNRNLPGLYGRFPILSAVSPNITVQYQMIFNQANYAPTALNARAWVPILVAFDSIIFSDWRAHKTSDPIDLERGRGRKALTRR